MIELRWVERDEPAPQYGPDIAITVRVLQYRYVDLPNDRIGEWQDVPTVTL